MPVLAAGIAPGLLDAARNVVDFSDSADSDSALGGSGGFAVIVVGGVPTWLAATLATKARRITTIATSPKRHL